VEFIMRGLIEPIPVQDIFVSGIGAIEKIGGGNLRFYLYVEQQSDDGTQSEKILVAKIVAPASAVPDAIMKMVGVIGAKEPPIIPLVTDLVH
jgi:hypothetical protein